MQRIGGAVAIGVALSAYVGCSEDPTGSNSSAAIDRDAAGDREAGTTRPPDGSGGVARDAARAPGGSGGAASHPAHDARVPPVSPDAADSAATPRDGGRDSETPDGDGAAIPDGAPEEDASAVAACIVVSGNGAAWPPSPAASTAPECVVNCDTAQCGSACTSGAPCDSGCCSGNQLNVTHGGNTASPDGYTRRAAMTRDAAGTFYRFVGDGRSYSETPAGGAASDERDLDCQNWITAPFSGRLTCTDAPAANPLLAVGGQVGQRVVYLTYALGTINPTFRFGVKRGAQWAFEDLPMYASSLAADPKGVAWISSNGKLYRRSRASTWINVGVPCGVFVESIAFDDSGALYLATGRNQIWRRDPGGVWGAEATPGAAQIVYLGAGTVHYSARPRSLRDGGGSRTFHYGRRVGTTWSQQTMDVGPADSWFSDYDLALDTCGAPHLAVTVEEPNYFWEVFYLRWTAAGWRSAPVYLTVDPPGAAIGVATTQASLAFFASMFEMGSASIPLR